MNAVEIEAAISDLALEPFDTAAFPYSFLEVFGHKDTTIKRLKGGNLWTRREHREGPFFYFGGSNCLGCRIG